MNIYFATTRLVIPILLLDENLIQILLWGYMTNCNSKKYYGRREHHSI